MIMRERYIKITASTPGKEAPWFIFRELIHFPCHRTFRPVVYLCDIAMMLTTEVRWNVNSVVWYVLTDFSGDDISFM